MTVSFRWVFGPLVLGFLLLGHVLPASAGNVPGSAQGFIPKISEVATGIVVRSVKDQVTPLRGGGGAVGVSTSGDLTGLQATSGGDTPLAFSLTHRLLRTPRLDGSIDVATAFLAGRNGGGMVYFGGIIGELGNLATPLDAGRINYGGIGLGFGVDYPLDENLYLTAIVGGMSLNYNVSRGGGAVTGSFGALRGFADLSLDYATRSAMGETTLGLGLNYVYQANDGYVESGGATVAPGNFSHLSLRANARNLWGDPGTMRPYLDLGAQVQLAGSATSAIAPVHLANQAQLMFGFEQTTGNSKFDFGLGATIDETGFSGLEARLAYTLRF